jgi:excisionase family DNA binding protein
MNTKEFRAFILDKLDELDQLYATAAPEAVLETSATYANAAQEVGDLAARLGHPGLYSRSRELLGHPDYASAVAYLAECLAAAQEPPEAKPIGETLTVDEVARMLGVSVRSVWRRRNDGTIPEPIKVGKSVRWPRAEFEKWLARR